MNIINITNKLNYYNIRNCTHCSYKNTLDDYTEFYMDKKYYCSSIFNNIKSRSLKVFTAISGRIYIDGKLCTKGAFRESPLTILEYDFTKSLKFLSKI